MKKKKIKVYFTMDEELYNEFEKHVEKNVLDRSRLIERLIAEYLKKTN